MATSLMGYRFTSEPGPRLAMRDTSGRSSTSTSNSVVFVAVNDAAMRTSLETLSRAGGWQPVVFVAGQEFLNCPRSTAPCCLILDIDLPELNGLELQARIASERREVPVIFLADGSDAATAVRAMKAGAFEFFAKPVREDLLQNAIREALERSRRTLVHETEKRALRDSYTQLSRRERQVMALVASGLANKQVGGELGISEITVKAHRGQVMQKMQANSFAHLIRMAWKLGVAAA